MAEILTHEHTAFVYRLNDKVSILLQVRHSVICENLANKKREPFDSSRKRAEGTDIPTLKPMKPKVRRFNSSITSSLTECVR